MLEPLASSLKVLALGGNKLGGTIPGALLGKFTKLEQLSLGGMEIEGACIH